MKVKSTSLPLALALLFSLAVSLVPVSPVFGSASTQPP
jgi:hypothetical protein